MNKRIKFILNSSFFVMVMLMLSKLLGLIRDSLIAKNYGLSYMNDIYMFCIGATMLLISISYGITAALIPIHTKIIAKKDIEYRNNFISNIINIVFFASVILSSIGIIGARGIISIFAPTFKREIGIYNEATMVLRIMFVSIIFVGMQSIITAVLQCHKQFITTTLMPITATLIYIVYLIFFINLYGLIGFGIAVVLGFMSMLIINIPTFIKLGYKFKFNINLKDEKIKDLMKKMVPIIITSSLVQVNVFIVRSFAGRLLNYGSISSLDYANKLNMIVYEVFAQAITIVIFPSLANYISNNDIKGFKKETISGINLMILIMIPASFGLLILRVPFITMFLKRGVFGNEEVMMTSSALLFYIPTMIIYGVRDVINRAFFSIDNTRYPMINSIINAIMNILMCSIFLNVLNVRGLALANSLSSFLALILLLKTLSKRVQGLDCSKIFLNISKTAIASFFMGIGVYFIKWVLEPLVNVDFIGSFIIIITSAVLGVIIYCIIQYFLKTEDFIKYINIIKDRERR